MSACPDRVRKGILLRVEGSGEPGARVIAFEFVDLRFDDGHIERWIGMGWPDHVPADRAALMSWAEGLAIEFDGVLGDELRGEFAGLPDDPFAGLPHEVVVEWNAQFDSPAAR